MDYQWNSWQFTGNHIVAASHEDFVDVFRVDGRGKKTIESPDYFVNFALGIRLIHVHDHRCIYEFVIIVQ